MVFPFFPKWEILISPELSFIDNGQLGFRIPTSVCITYNGMMQTLCNTQCIKRTFFSVYCGHPKKERDDASGFLFSPNMQYNWTLNNGFKLCGSSYMWIFFSKYSWPFTSVDSTKHGLKTVFLHSQS